jgi:hypothetical protein
MTSTHFDQLQLAERWALSARTLERWRVNCIGPKFILLPGKVIYRLCNVEADENECLVSYTAEIRRARKPLDKTPTVADRPSLAQADFLGLIGHALKRCISSRL